VSLSITIAAVRRILSGISIATVRSLSAICEFRSNAFSGLGSLSTRPEEVLSSLQATYILVAVEGNWARPDQSTESPGTRVYSAE